MVLCRDEKEEMVLDLYYNKGYTYRQIAKELRMSPNQIREVIKRHEEKNDAISNKKKVLSLSSQAYKLFYEGKNSVQVAIELDLPEDRVTQFRLEYWRLRNQDKLEQLYRLTKDKLYVLWKIYKELIIIGGLSIEEVANVISTGLWYQLSTLYKELVRTRGLSIEEVIRVVDIDLNILPEMERRLDQTTRELAIKEVELDMIKVRISALEEEEDRRRNKIFTLPSSSYPVENSSTNAPPYYLARRRSPSLPHWSSGDYDP